MRPPILLSLRLSLLLGPLLLGGTASAQKFDPRTNRASFAERYDAGPRRAARLLACKHPVRFAITTSSEDAQRFFDQGVYLLHCGQSFEADRAFHTASMHDKRSAMPFLGMVLANAANPDRAVQFVWEAYRRRAGATRLERRLIAAYAQHWGATQEPPKEVTRAVRRGQRSGREAPVDTASLVGVYRSLADAHPEHLELRALWAYELWRAHVRTRRGASSKALRARVDEIVRTHAKHPAWRYLSAVAMTEDGLARLAQRCGPAAPGIASMWSVSGRAYEAAALPDEALRAKEAALRVGNAQMLQLGMLPYELHGHASSTASYCGALLRAGRARDALACAQRFAAYPRHPRRGGDKDGALAAACVRACLARAAEGVGEGAKKKRDRTSAITAPERLGPLTWTPALAPDCDLPRGGEGRMTRAELLGKPTLLVFFLGFG